MGVFMTKKKKDASKFELVGASDVSAEEVEKRTQFARMRQLELSVLKDEIGLADRAGDLCRIETALDEFDKFLIDFVRLLRQIPDKVQLIVPQMKPDQYTELRTFIDTSLQMLSERRLHLTIESTKTEKALATATKEESQKKAAKLKGKDHG
jgi:hypothetical protein